MAFLPPIDWGVLPCATPILEPLLPAKPELAMWQSLHEVPLGSDRAWSLKIWLPRFSRRVKLVWFVGNAGGATVGWICGCLGWPWFCAWAKLILPSRERLKQKNRSTESEGFLENFVKFIWCFQDEVCWTNCRQTNSLASLTKFKQKSYLKKCYFLTLSAFKKLWKQV